MKVRRFLAWLKKEGEWAQEEMGTPMSEETAIVLDAVSEKITGVPARVEVNRNRRRLLSAVVLGSGAIMLQNALRSVANVLTGDIILNEKIFNNFIVRETGKSLSFLDRQTKEEILVIDKE